MKIAQVVCSFPPYRGGIGNVAYHLADNLSRENFEVTVFTPKRKKTDDDIIGSFKIEKLMPLFKFGNAAILPQLFIYLFKFDVIHFHYPFIGSSLAPILVKLIKGKKVKLILHYHMDLVGRNWKSIIYKLYNFIFIKYLVRFADKIIITSDDYLPNSLLYKYYLKYKNKFYVVPNGVNTEFFKPKSKDPRLVGKYNLENKKVILFVGALDSSHYFKGVNYLIKSFQLLNHDNVKLIIVGEGDLKSVYQDMASSFGLHKNTIFTGYVPDEELVKFYNLCDIFVLPSIDKSEAFGMVLVEAMACSKPVIATDLPGVRKVVNAKENGLIVKPKNIQQLTDQIQYLLDHEDLCYDYGISGRKKVEDNFGWQRITKKLIELYVL